MLRTCAAQCGKPAATLSHNTTMAANLISMVFRIHHFKRLGAGAAAKRKPCLADLRLAWLVGLVVGGKHTHGKLWPMGRKNQRYSFETKMEVVIRYLDGDDPDWLAQEYGIKSEKLIHTWVKKWQNSGDAGLDPRMRGSINTDANTETELERLRRENYRLRMERDVLITLKALREGRLDGGWG